MTCNCEQVPECNPDSSSKEAEVASQPEQSSSTEVTSQPEQSCPAVPTTKVLEINLDPSSEDAELASQSVETLHSHWDANLAISDDLWKDWLEKNLESTDLVKHHLDKVEAQIKTMYAFPGYQEKPLVELDTFQGETMTDPLEFVTGKKQPNTIGMIEFVNPAGVVDKADDEKTDPINPCVSFKKMDGIVANLVYRTILEIRKDLGQPSTEARRKMLLAALCEYFESLMQIRHDRFAIALGYVHRLFVDTYRKPPPMPLTGSESTPAPRPFNIETINDWLAARPRRVDYYSIMAV